MIAPRARVLLVILAACGKSKPSGPPITFAASTPAVGAKLVRTVTSRSTINSAGVAYVTINERHETIVILAADAQRVTRARVKFDDDTTMDTQNGKGQSAPNFTELAGRTYTLELGGAAPVATDDGGDKVDEYAAGQIAQHEADLATGQAVARYLAGKTITPGDEIDVPVEAIAPPSGEPTVKDAAMHLVLDGLDGTLAKFDVTSHGATGGDTAVKFENRGTLWIDPASPWSFRSDTHGTVTMSGAGITASGPSESTEALAPAP